MNTEPPRQPPARHALRAKIVQAASELISHRGIKSVTMDDIAMAFGISKRTLYEVFADKETLLKECILYWRNEEDAYSRKVASMSGNVLEILLKCYQYTIEHYRGMNKKFFEEIKKYPRAYELFWNGNRRSSEDVLNFFRQGVEQGYFRDDVNFVIIGHLVHKQLDILLDSDLCEKYSFLEVYESIMFTTLRGISTPKGAAELDRFICECRMQKTEPGCRECL